MSDSETFGGGVGRLIDTGRLLAFTGRLFEVDAFSRFRAYSNKYGKSAVNRA